MTEPFAVAVLRKPNAPLEIEFGRISRLGNGQCLVSLEAIGVCGSQLLEIAGGKNNAKYMPHLLGHEGVGVILDCHNSVTRFKPGDKVVIHWKKSLGIEAGGSEIELTSGEKLRGGPATTFAECSVISENRMTKIQDDADIVTGTLLGCGLSTGFGAVDNQLNIKLGMPALVFGAGGVGLSIILALKLKGLVDIHVIDKDVSKMNLAKELGASQFWTELDEFREFTKKTGLKFKYVFEATGAKFARQSIADFLGDQGTVVVLGQSGSNEGVNLGLESMLFGSGGSTLIFSQGGEFAPELDIPRWTKVLSENKSYVGKLGKVTDGPLASINQLLDNLREGHPGRQILKLI